MRKIEEQIQDALRNKLAGKFGTTEVVVSDAGNVQVILHGSPVVRTENKGKSVFVSLAGYNTNVTRSRINLALDLYGVPRIGNKKGAPYIGGREIPVTGWVQVVKNGHVIEAKPEVLQ